MTKAVKTILIDEGGTITHEGTSGFTVTARREGERAGEGFVASCITRYAKRRARALEKRGAPVGSFETAHNDESL